MERTKLNELVELMAGTRYIFDKAGMLNGDYVSEELATIGLGIANTKGAEPLATLYTHNLANRLHSSTYDFDGDPTPDSIRQDRYMANYILKCTIEMMAESNNRDKDSRIADAYSKDRDNHAITPSIRQYINTKDDVEFIGKAREIFNNLNALPNISFDDVMDKMRPYVALDRIGYVVNVISIELYHYTLEITGEGGSRVKDYIPRKFRKLIFNDINLMKELTIAAAITSKEDIISKLKSPKDFDAYIGELHRRYLNIDAPYRKELAKELMNKAKHTFDTCRICINEMTEYEAKSSLAILDKGGINAVMLEMPESVFWKLSDAVNGDTSIDNIQEEK